MDENKIEVLQTLLDAANGEIGALKAENERLAAMAGERAVLVAPSVGDDAQFFELVKAVAERYGSFMEGVNVHGFITATAALNEYVDHLLDSRAPAAPSEEAVILSDLAKLLPGSYYMDSPDGGDVHVMEQLRRMAEDASKFRQSASAPSVDRNAVLEKAAALFAQPHMEYFGESIQVAIRSLKSAAPAKPEPAVPENIMVPKWAGQFDTHQDWVRRAQRVLSVPDHMAKYICVDAMGRRCHIGADMQRAKDEGAFPVRYFWECEITAAPVAQPLAPSGAVSFMPLPTMSQFASFDDYKKAMDEYDEDMRNSAQPLAGQDVRAVTEDAARYRWLRDHGDTEGQPCIMFAGHWYGGSNKVGFPLDAAVDAAMSAPSPVNPKQEQ